MNMDFADISAEARRAMDALGLWGSYKSTQVTRSFPDPIPPGGSHHYHADARSLDLMRRRAREAERNHLLAQAVIATDQEMTVGSGFTFRCHTKDDEWNTAAEGMLYQWLGFATLPPELGDRVRAQRRRAQDGRRNVPTVPMAAAMPRMDASRRRTIDELMAEIVRAWEVEGDIALLRTDRLSVQIIEAERIISPGGRVALDDQSRMFDGVEINGDGELVALHVGTWDARGRLRQETRRIDAEDVLYLPNPLTLKGNAMRTAPTLDPCLERFKHLEEVDRCARMAAWVQTALTAFIVSNAPGMMAERMGAAIEDESAAGRVQSRRTVDIGPGMFNFLQAGEDIKFLEPKSPGMAFETYMRTQLMQIGAVTRLPMWAIGLDGRELNLSTIRAILEQAYRTIERKQAVLVAHVATPLAWWALGNFVRMGLLPMREDWHELEVSPPPKPVMDAQVEATVIEKLMGMGLMSQTTAGMRYGGINVRSEHTQIRREVQEAREAGVTHPAMAQQAIAADPNQNASQGGQPDNAAPQDPAPGQ